MNAAQKNWLGAGISFALALVIAIAWAVVCLLSGGKLLMNGPWALAVILFAATLVFVLRAWAADAEDLKRARHKANHPAGGSKGSL